MSYKSPTQTVLFKFAMFASALCKLALALFLILAILWLPQVDHALRTGQYGVNFIHWQGKPTIKPKNMDNFKHERDQGIHKELGPRSSSRSYF